MSFKKDTLKSQKKKKDKTNCKKIFIYQKPAVFALLPTTKTLKKLFFCSRQVMQIRKKLKTKEPKSNSADVQTIEFLKVW